MSRLPRHKFIRGRCMTKCPEKEILLREQNGLLHPLEMMQMANGQFGAGRRNTSKTKAPVSRADWKRVVKSYSRPAAGQGPPDPSEIRPPQVLLDTVRYLITEVVPCNTRPWNEVYDFVFDRLRAVRQDLVVQGSPSVASVKILEPIVRFLAYAGYRLCEDPVSHFDPTINKQHLLECVKRLLVVYDQQLEDEPEFSSRSDVEALYLVLVPGSTDALLRALGLPSEYRTHSVNCAYEFSLSCYLGNYVRAVRQINKLPVLPACIAALHLPHIHRQALSVMSVAFSSRNLRYPSKALTDLLLMRNEAALVNECRHYGLDADIDTGVAFSKNSFNCDIQVRKPVHVEAIDKKLSLADITELLLGEPESLKCPNNSETCIQ